MYKEIIKDICNELDIKYEYLSKDWLIKLEYNNKIKYLANNKFPINDYVVGKIMDDKYALYEILHNLNIPVCLHHILFNINNNATYTKGCHTKEDILNIYNKYNHDVVVKPNNGSQGKNVYHIKDIDELYEITNKLLETNYSISICPFYHIKNEYRVIILDNEIKLLYKKINPIVIGDGIHTLKELLINFNEYYFKDIDIPNIILKKNEEYIYDFRFNLSKGSIASLDIDEYLKNKLSELALDVTKKVGIRFASIDIIETTDNELLVLEANSGVTMNKVINFIPKGYNIAKDIYKEAILKMFED